ncbi:NAD(P)-binding protein [Dichomitus squalens]|uniref:NAD(P)-binding protein n=1 Tax=Dichomitus squalens TaxID=114155 RepID=A0A4Q9PZW6_9APHY|nr:NAD(P)-binding protein [Dichomitus squalens]TBU60397.1 NAD(P)-binding protein [Dichomitus squalens]
MPAITTGKILDLLEHGFSVRATVRSLEKADALKSVFGVTYGDRLEFVVVNDFTAKGAFDEALKGINGVVHAATPVRPSSDDPEAFIGPAVQSVSDILSAASAPGSTIKRVVYVSSVSAVNDPARSPELPDVLTDKDWNETDVVTVREKGKAASPFAKYQASKTLAGRKAWEVYNEGKAEGTIGWDLVTLCPPWVFGPYLGEATPEGLNYSVGAWYRTVVQETLPLPPPLNVRWTDVRDFAEASRLALTKPEAGGERFLISAPGPSLWGRWVNVGRRVLGKAGEPRPESPEDGQKLAGLDSQKSQDLLGLKYHTVEETTAFILDDFKKRGWA